MSTTRTESLHSSSAAVNKNSFFDPLGTMNGFGQTQTIPLASIEEVNMDETQQQTHYNNYSQGGAD